MEFSRLEFWCRNISGSICKASVLKAQSLDLGLENLTFHCLLTMKLKLSLVNLLTHKTTFSSLISTYIEEVYIKSVITYKYAECIESAYQ